MVAHLADGRGIVMEPHDLDADCHLDLNKVKQAFLDGVAIISITIILMKTKMDYAATLRLTGAPAQVSVEMLSSVRQITISLSMMSASGSGT